MGSNRSDHRTTRNGLIRFLLCDSLVEPVAIISLLATFERPLAHRRRHDRLGRVQPILRLLKHHRL